MAESEIARLRAQIEQECQASWQALYGLASGNAQHEVISTRMRRMDTHHQRLKELLGDEQATELVCQVYNHVGEMYAPDTVTNHPLVTRQTGLRSTAQAVFRTIVLVQEEK